MPDAISQEQYEIYVSNYSDETIKVIRAEDLRSGSTSDVYICDESDLLLDKYAVIFVEHPITSELSIRGLAAPFHGKKTYFMSATYDALQKKLLKQTFLYGETDILEF